MLLTVMLGTVITIRNTLLQSLPMPSWCNEVKTAVYSCVHNVTSIEPRLILKITLKLVIHIIHNWFETEKINLALLSFMSEKTQLEIKIICTCILYVNKKYQRQKTWEVKLDYNTTCKVAKSFQKLRNTYLSLLSMPSPYPGVSTIVRRSLTPLSSISTVEVSIFTVLFILSENKQIQSVTQTRTQ